MLRTRNKNEKKINLSRMSEKDTKALLKILKSNKDLNYFSQQHHYYSHKSKKNQYKLSHSFFIRECNPDGKYPGQTRCEVISHDLIAKSKFGEVRPIDKTLNIIKYKKILIKKKHDANKRLVKIEKLKEEYIKDDVIKAYRIANHVNHLSVKPPVFFKETALTTMRNLQGKDLYDILYEDQSSEDSDLQLELSVDKAINIALAILLAYQQQITYKGVVHRDLKPENIRIINVGNEYKAIIMDYGFSKWQTDSDLGRVYGTKNYIAPEVIQGNGSSLKSDIYSLGETINEVFNCCLDITHLEGKRISNLLDKMRASNPRDRSDLFYAIKEMQDIKNQNILMKNYTEDLMRIGFSILDKEEISGKQNNKIFNTLDKLLGFYNGDKIELNESDYRSLKTTELGNFLKKYNSILKPLLADLDSSENQKNSYWK